MRHKWKIAAVIIWLGGAVLAAFAGHLAQEGKGSMRLPGSVHAAVNSPGPSVSPSPATFSSDSSGSLDSSWQSRYDAAERKKEELEKEQQEIEKKVDNIQEFVTDVAKYVRTLDFQMTQLLDNIDTNKEQVKQVEQEVEDINEEYEFALERQQERYNAMKAHIKYMYENSHSNYLGYLMESQSLADLFSREEYIEKVTDYDKVLLAKYQSVLDEVTVAKSRVQEKEDEIVATRNSLKYEKEKLEELSTEKTRQIKVYQGLVKDSKEDAAQYARQIEQQQNAIEALLQEGRQAIYQREQDGDTVQVMPTTGDYAWPLPVSGRITSPFGYRSAPTAGASTYHKGVDIAVPTGTKILACKEGKVVTAAYSSSAGNYVGIYHGGGIYSYYMHCSQLTVSVDQRVKKGQVIAKSGSTGISTGPHLHFAIYKGGNYVNPMYYVKQP